MIMSALSRALRPARAYLKAARHGWVWEKVSFGGQIQLSSGRWSRSDGGQIWQRWNGSDYDFVQVPMMP